MFENHQRLKQSRTQAKSLEQNFNSIKERLESLKQRNARLEQDVKNFEEREKHLENIRIMQMKRPWLVRMKKMLFLKILPSIYVQHKSSNLSMMEEN